MNSLAIVTVIASIVSLSVGQSIIGPDFVNFIKDDLAEFVASGSRTAHLVRLSFHACVGGCDGCLNHNDTSNAGNWLNTVENLNDRYDDSGLSGYLSRADYYHLASIVAIEYTAEAAGVTLPDIPFIYGRVDCDTAPYTDELYEFPTAHFNYDETTTYFADNFGMTADESVAILGAHTLGATTAAGSGFGGAFLGDSDLGDQWDEKYFIALDNIDSYSYRNVDKSSTSGADSPRWMWTGTADDDDAVVAATNFLNADVSLAVDLTIDEDGQGTCLLTSRRNSDLEVCSAHAEGSATVARYAASFDDWMADFVPAFLKMTAADEAIYYSDSVAICTEA